MAKRHFGESKQDFEKRAKQEFLETTSGKKKSFFESQDSYERRAERKVLERTSGEKSRYLNRKMNISKGLGGEPWRSSQAPGKNGRNQMKHLSSELKWRYIRKPE